MVSANLVQVSCLMSPRVVAGLDRLAAAAKMSRAAYAATLINAAYTARHGATGDRDLDAAVGRVAVLMGAGLDAVAIAELLDLAAETVQRIIDGWMLELAGRAA